MSDDLYQKSVYDEKLSDKLKIDKINKNGLQKCCLVCEESDL